METGTLDDDAGVTERPWSHCAPLDKHNDLEATLSLLSAGVVGADGSLITATPSMCVRRLELKPARMPLRLDYEPRSELKAKIAALHGGNEACSVGVKSSELGAGRAAIPGLLQRGVEIPAAGPDMRPVAPADQPSRFIDSVWVRT
jgi:hypothetical protein